jgi:hypothetical protein
MLEDKTIEALIKRIEFEMGIVDTMLRNGVEEKFKYLMIGKVNGMIEMLRLIKS